MEHPSIGGGESAPKRVHSSLNFSHWKRRPSLCHLDRSAAQWRDLCVDALTWKCFSLRSGDHAVSFSAPDEIDYSIAHEPRDFSTERHFEADARVPRGLCQQRSGAKERVGFPPHFRHCLPGNGRGNYYQRLSNRISQPATGQGIVRFVGTEPAAI